MNNVKVKAGQLWEFKSGVDNYGKGDRIRIGDFDDICHQCYPVNFDHLKGDIFCTNDFIYECFEFIPQTDLEWLVVNVNKWASPQKLIYRQDDIAYQVNKEPWGAFSGECYTEQQWQDKRYELGLDEKPVDESDLTLNVNDGTSCQLSKYNSKERREMNEIKIPVRWLKDKGIKFIAGDGQYNKSCIGNCAVDYFNSDLISGDTLFITSFADRENTGKQPVADWVPVVVSGRGLANGERKGLSCELTWSKNVHDPYKTWKPNAKALMEIYSNEQQDKKVSFSHNLWADSFKEGMSYSGTKKVKPIYTKQMWVDGKIPQVGSSILIRHKHNINNSWFEVEVEFYGDFKAIFTTKEVYEVVIELGDFDYKYIETKGESNE